MIRYRRSNRVRDIVGAIFLALAALLLWVQTSDAGLKTGWAIESSVTVEAAAEVDAPPTPAGPGASFLSEAHG